MDPELNFSKNFECDIIFKKGQQQLHFLKKLRSFNVDKNYSGTLVQMFCSVFSLSQSRLVGNLSMSDKSKLQQLANICCNITDEQQLSLSNMYK